jgi:hypothetical protein
LIDYRDGVAAEVQELADILKLVRAPSVPASLELKLTSRAKPRYNAIFANGYESAIV